MTFQPAFGIERPTPDPDMTAVGRHALEMVQMPGEGGFASVPPDEVIEKLGA